MNILVGRISDSHQNGKNKISDRPANKVTSDRRKSKRDRRKSVREGIVVTLSVKNDRRSGRDRRKSS